MPIVTGVTAVTEEAESIPWLKVFGDVDLSGVKGKAKSGVKVGTKCQYWREKTVYPQITNVTDDALDDNKIIIGHEFCQLRLNKGKSIQ